MFDGIVRRLGNMRHVLDLKTNLISFSTLNSKVTNTLVKMEF